MNSLLRVMLWGPTGAGKSWLAYGLARELEYISTIDEKFTYALNGSNNLPVYVNVDQAPNPTQEMEDIVFTFHRFEKKEPQDLIVAHEVEIHDNMGLNLVQALGLSGSSNFQAELTLSKSIAVMALFDCRSEEFGGSIPMAGIISGRSDYANYANELCQLIVQQPGDKKYLAACISKIDFYPGFRQPARDIFGMLFPEVLAVMEKYERLIDINYFAISSMGFLRSGNNYTANFNSDTGSLENSGQWLPYNVAAPFFWIFEEVEKDLKKPRYPLFKPYPRSMR